MIIEAKNKENSNIIVKGRFLIIKWGGPSVDWKKTLWVFESASDRTQYFIYTNQQGIKTSHFYEVELKRRDLQKSKYSNASYDLINFKLYQPHNNIDIERMLLANVDGLGPKGLEIIKNNVPDGEMKKIIENPKLVEKALKPKVYDSLVRYLQEYNDNDYEFFVKHGLTILQSKLKKKFENQNFVMRYSKGNDPYELYIDNWIDLKLVDKFALNVNPNLEPHKRIRAFIYKIFRSSFSDITSFFKDDIALYKKLWSWYEQYRYSNNENCTMFEKVYVTQLLELIFSNASISTDDILNTIEAMIQRREIIIDNEFNRLMLSEVYEQEFFIAKRLEKIKELGKSFEYAKTISNELAREQNVAYNIALENPVSIITGYPGTGKSYLISHIIKTLLSNKKYKNKDIAILTPTGRAATILTYKTGLEAKTIHSFLRLSASEDDENLIEAFETHNPIKVIIIDEFSMVNLQLFYNILKICNKLEKIVIVGDRDQLPCIGKGNLLEDIINSECFPVTTLREVYRTEKKDIFNHFLAINENRKPKLNTESVKFIEQNPNEFLKNIVSIYEEKVKKYSIDEVIILLPAYLELGMPGIKEVNKRLQEWNLKKNKDKEKLDIFTNLSYYVGDKVIQMVNDYEKNVFNGEIGFITKIEKSANTSYIIVTFDGEKQIKYSKSEILENLSLAYAITIHKFQGSESKCVIFGILKNKVDHMFNKKFMYTAVSRAKEELLLLGSADLYIQKILSPNSEVKYYTKLKSLIKQESKPWS
ncbi:ATP-dependent DNA helicase [Mycoplasmopsis primatum]|uniref:ATP-dependent DNA helicase n=1 Tax=Mycoplasmopsis primatum TaxID=55604 RepID=UPI000494DBBD|nr:ATP-dependent RecD-like DNA helicase [Mycoplasmopsis primatum]